VTGDALEALRKLKYVASRPQVEVLLKRPNQYVRKEAKTIDVIARQNDFERLLDSVGYFRKERSGPSSMCRGFRAPDHSLKSLTGKV
jgi:hypothetical protein